ncbi:MAG TPA: restriction endonuclease [Candidatus Saccharimonadales bacterium]|nr:restriction endonuclease [Candidatus Saccharimonadales bacterium]
MPRTSKGSDINAALRQFEGTEANLAKLERLWAEIEKLTPDGFCFGTDPAYDERARAYQDVLKALPKIDGWKPDSEPMELNAIAQSRLDAKEVGEISAEVAVEDMIEAPGRELADYRHRLNKKRRQMIRTVMADLISRVDETIHSLEKTISPDIPVNEKVTGEEWEDLVRQIQEIEMLLGSALPRPSRWRDLSRHLKFGMVQDLLDILQMDWPAVKSGLTKGLYNENEPIPVEVEDIGALAATRPTGTVATRLKWKSLDNEGFERLIFALISAAPGYENPAWLMSTNAPDRGRDLSVIRVINDPLGGVMRSRVIIQCKHWLKRSISPADVAALKEQMTLWTPPRVDVLVIATSGRFSADAVGAIENHNQSDRALRIEMWPESHLEGLLAGRDPLIAEFRLR